MAATASHTYTSFGSFEGDDNAELLLSVWDLACLGHLKGVLPHFLMLATDSAMFVPLLFEFK